MPEGGSRISQQDAVDELRSQRNPQEDMPVVFDRSEEQIATSPEQINESTKAYFGKLEPGIFDKLKNIEHVYTPEGKIRKYSVEIGGKTAAQLEQELKENGIIISKEAQDLLHSRDFTTQKDKEQTDLVRLKVGDLGFSDYSTTDQVYARAKELGLDLCPAEAGPHLRLAYKDQPMGEWLFVGMKQINDSEGGRDVFALGRDGVGLCLDGAWAGPGGEWGPDDGFVFARRK